MHRARASASRYLAQPQWHEHQSELRKMGWRSCSMRIGLGCAPLKSGLSEDRRCNPHSAKIGDARASSARPPPRRCGSTRIGAFVDPMGFGQRALVAHTGGWVIDRAFLPCVVGCVHDDELELEIALDCPRATTSADVDVRLKGTHGSEAKGPVRPESSTPTSMSGSSA